MRSYLWICIGLASWIAGGLAWGQEGSKLVVPKHETDALDLQLGGNILSIDGNRYKFEQYGTPQDGIYLKRLWFYGSRPGLDTLALDLWQPGAIDTNLKLTLYSPWPVGRYRAYFATWREHPELTIMRVNRRDQGFEADVPVGNLLSVQGQLWEKSFSPALGNVFPQHPSTLYPDYLMNGGGLGLVVPYGPAELTVRSNVSRFSDGTNYQPSNITHENTAELRAAITPDISGVLSVAEAKMKITSRPVGREPQVGHDVKETVARLDVQGTVREDVAIRAYLSKSNSTRNFSQSGYAKEMKTAGLRLAWSGVRGLFVRAGVESRDIDYLTANRQATLSPKVQTSWINARYRPIREVELSAKLSSRKREDLPGSTFGRPPVTPRDATRSEFGVSYTPGEVYGLSYRFVQEREENPDRNMITRIQLNDWLGWTQLNDRLSLTASYGEHRFKSRFLAGVALQEGASLYLSDARVLSGSIAYTIDRRWWLDASYSEAKSLRAVDVRERVFSLAAHTRLSHDSEGTLEYINQNFDDRQNRGNDYDADRFAFWWKKKL